MVNIKPPASPVTFDFYTFGNKFFVIFQSNSHDFIFGNRKKTSERVEEYHKI